MLRQFAIYAPSGQRGKVAPAGDTGDTTVRNRGVCWGPLGSDQWNSNPAKDLQRRRKRRRTVMPEEGLEPPTRGL